MDTQYYRDVFGWVGLTLDELDSSCVLRILTEKRQLDQNLVTTVTTLTKGEDAVLTRTRGIDDFHEAVAVSTPRRVTEALVRAQHESVLKKLNTIRARALRADAHREA